MKLALLMRDNCYSGREYMQAIIKQKIHVDVIKIGSYPTRDDIEEFRCGHLWHPPLLEDICNMTDVHSFPSLNDARLMEFLKDKEYDIGLQGGVGILKNPVIQAFREGILNFHPGKLPQYRGCSAPEWQLLEEQPIIATCHLVDEKIDHGPIYKEKKLDVNYESYHAMRASIYPEMAKFMIEVLGQLSPNIRQSCSAQDEQGAIYRQYMGDTNIIALAKTNHAFRCKSFAYGCCALHS